MNPSPLLIYLLTLECKKNCTKQGDGYAKPRLFTLADA
ncbi:unnamed protein product [Penicillium camemberti]|uniref:Str. FM013 n=1 Tax=Penicillium camemberti (strain FM 013) TaxID=1429867 RepID=A0A0G4NYE8_PENC3|nr:unnamed protein product [Penicillium camemberti]